MEVEVGNLLFIEDTTENKKRPHICINVFRNNAGVPYNWLVVPITSADTVGKNNLVEVKHRKLNYRSFAKLNNVTSITLDGNVEVSKVKFAKKYLKQIINKLKECLNNNINI